MNSFFKVVLKAVGCLVLPVSLSQAADVSTLELTNSIFPVVINGAAPTPIIQTWSSVTQGRQSRVVFGRNYDTGPITTVAGLSVPNGRASAFGIADLDTATFAISVHSDLLTQGNLVPYDLVGYIQTTSSISYSDVLTFQAPDIKNNDTTKVRLDLSIDGSMSAETKKGGTANLRTAYSVMGYGTAGISHHCYVAFTSCQDESFNNFAIDTGQATVTPGALTGGKDVIHIEIDAPVFQGVATIGIGVQLTADATSGTVDFLHTAQMTVLTDPGVTWTSSSGFDLRPPVPEPATAWMLLLGSVVLARKRTLASRAEA